MSIPPANGTPAICVQAPTPARRVLHEATLLLRVSCDMLAEQVKSLDPQDGFKSIKVLPLGVSMGA